MVENPSFSPSGIVSLTTDFGQQDGYVGAMKGVLLRIDRSLSLVDVAHDVSPQSVPQGAAAMAGACPWFPRGTVHVGVVDPGVGTARAGIVVLAGGHAFVGPDNGLFTAAAARLGGIQATYRIDGEERLSAFVSSQPSSTFHGRDLFAPTAGALATGQLTPAEIGPVHTPITIEAEPPRSDPDGLHGRITHVDRFGNAVSNIKAAHLSGEPTSGCRVRVGSRDLPLVRTYGEVETGEACALFGSDGHLEIAVRDGDAAAHLELAVGTPIDVVRT